MSIKTMTRAQMASITARTPKPADFDAFWDDALKTLDAIDPAPVLTPYDFPSVCAECFTLTFASTGGARIYAKFLRPRHMNSKAPALLMFHGLSGRSGNWCDLLSYVSQGFCIAALDSRGQGGYSQDVGGTAGTTWSSPFIRGLDGDPRDLLIRQLFLDTAMLARVVMAMDFVDETRMGVFGRSQGGGLALACAALVPQIKLCAAQCPYMADYKRVWEMDLDKDAYDGLRYYLKHFDPRHERHEEIFTKLGYIDVAHLAARIRAKVLMATGLLDTTCPPEAQLAAYNNIRSEKKLCIYPDFTHEEFRGQNDMELCFFTELLK